jgi:DNA-directed RNA polymerase subunit H (RpoH/RPB5)
MESTSLEYVLIQSRITILDLLERRGYETAPFRKFIGPEAGKLFVKAFTTTKVGPDDDKSMNTVTNVIPSSLNMVLKAKDGSNRVAYVEYSAFNIKQSAGNGSYMATLEEKYGTAKKSDEVEYVVLYMMNPAEVKTAVDDKDSPYDRAALSAWLNEKKRIQFFSIQRLVSNPLDHILQPKFEIVPKEEIAELKKQWHMKGLDDLPKIRFHNDMAARCLGLVPLDVVKITRGSITSGEYIEYRVCVP